MDTKQLSLLLKQYLVQLEQIENNIEMQLPDGLKRTCKGLLDSEFHYYPVLNSLSYFIESFREDIDTLNK